MKFNCTVSIKAPIDTVVELFDNVENLDKWQDGFISFEHLSGTVGEKGAKSKLIYKIGKKEMELIETIITKELPNQFIGLYEAKTMTNIMKNSFVAVSENLTRYDVEIEYTKFNGFMVKAMAFLMPGMFKKQTQKWLNQFRDFVEGV